MADNGLWSRWMLGSEKLASSNTLPEHHSALALLQQLDHAWFHDNLLKPRGGLIDAFLPSAQPLSPYQSVELTDAARSKWAVSPFSQRPRSGEMPCARFEALSCTRTLGSTRLSGNDASQGSKDALEHDHRPESVHALVSQRHVFSNPLADTVLVPPAPLQAWVVKDLPNFKEFEANENIRPRNLKTVERGKHLRVSLVDGQLPQPALKVLGTKKAQRKSSKSMTALEFDELQGFMDLGFHFSQDDLTPRIVSMFPALRYKFEEDGGSKQNLKTIVTKPSQSSVATWLVQRSAAPLHPWQVPATSEDMKEHLKFWARAVASTVRQEC